MSAIIARQVSALMEVASLAHQLVEAEAALRDAKSDLNAAYNRFKYDRDLDNVARDTPHWDLMMVMTKPEFEAASKARRRVYSAKRKLRAAVLRSTPTAEVAS